MNSQQGRQFSSSDAQRLLAAARRLVLDEAEAVRRVAESLDDTFVSAVRYIRCCSGKLVTIGVGTSAPVAQRMAHLLSTTGTPSMFLHPGDAVLGGLGGVTSGDVVVAISRSGSSPEVVTFATRAKERGAALVVLTAAPGSPLAKLAHVAVVLPHSPRADPGGVIAMGSSLAASAWGDGLAIVLMQINGCEWDRVLGDVPGSAARRGRPPRALPRLPDPSLRSVTLRPKRPVRGKPA